jgi:hypothetical protein
MAFSDASAALNFYAEKLAELRKTELPDYVVWQLPYQSHIRNTQISVRQVRFRGKHHVDATGYNHYGDEGCNNVVFFFRAGTEYDNERWHITIHDWDDPQKPLEWSLSTPSGWRLGFPQDVEQQMRHLIVGLFDYAEEHCGYKPAMTKAEYVEFFGDIQGRVAKARKDSDRRRQQEHQKDCDCDYCNRMMRVFSHRVE